MPSALPELDIVHIGSGWRSAPPTPTDLNAELNAILDRAQNDLIELETLIQIADQLLDKLQPHAPGKIRIAWWRKRRHNELTPVFVQLSVGMGGRWYLKAVSTKDVHKLVKRAGEFNRCHELVYKTVVLAKELLKRRGALLGLVRQHMQAIKNTFPYQADARAKSFAALDEIYKQSVILQQDS